MEVVLVHAADPLAPVEGGAIRFSLCLLNYLVKRGVDVTFLGVQTEDRPVQNLPYTFVPVLKGSYDWRLFLAKLFVLAPSLQLPPTAIIQTFRLDTILPFVLFRRRNPKAMVSDEPLHVARVAYKPIFPLVQFAHGFVEAYCMRRLDALITDARTATHYQRRYPRTMKSNLFVMSHAGVDTDVFRPMDRGAARAALGLNLDDPVVVFVGRIEAVKDLDFLIASFARFQAEIPGAKLAIVGRGSEEARLKRLVRDHGPAGVLFLGEYPPDKVLEVVNCADMLAICSVTEGGPMVLREALACGIPVVSNDVGDVASIITSERLGRVVPKDEKAFASAMLDVLEMVRRERATVREECVRAAQAFTYDKVGEAMFSMYHQIQHRRDRKSGS